MSTTTRPPSGSGHRAPRRDRRVPALVVAVAALAATAGAALSSGGGEPTPAASASPATVTVTVEVPAPDVRTAGEIADDAFVLRAVQRGWTSTLTATGSVTEARALCAVLDADPDPSTLTSALADLEARTGIPPLDAWAFADDAVRTYCRDLVQLLP